MNNNSTFFEIQVGDILEFSADVVFFKYAQGFYGANAAALKAISNSGLEIRSWPRPHDYKFVNTKGVLASPAAVFVGVKPLFALDYDDIRDFGIRAVEWIAKKFPSASHAAMTMHGSGFGLDEVEAAQALLEGCKLAIQTFSPPSLERITWVEIDKKRADRLRTLLSPALQEFDLNAIAAVPGEPTSPTLPGSQKPTSGDTVQVEGVLRTGSSNQFGKKPLVFVAMPFSTEFEIGYAWGKGRPTILLFKEETRFDTRNQKILRYGSIMELNKKLAKELRTIKQGL